MATKADKVADLLQRRIQHGDYAGREIPTEVSLSTEIGISRPTIRKAIERLVGRGVISRLPNGRLAPADGGSGESKKRMTVCLLGPAFVNANASQARFALDHMAEKFNAVIRSVEFVHWDDACIGEVLNGFDGVFLMPSSEPMSESVYDRIQSARASVVALHADLSPMGIPSIDLTPVSAFHKIFDHLYAQGHRQLDCLNTQPFDLHMQRRVEQWRLWRAARGVEGRLINHPVKNYDDPMRRAYDVFKDHVRSSDFSRGNAVWCTTMPAVKGAIRAAHEAGLHVGRDLALAGADDEGAAWVNTPSLTCVCPPSPTPYLTIAMEWMQSGGPWPGPILMRPDDVPLYIGESTQPAERHST
jgi:DNA-binding LacI/PurR family transcriptional regulator